MKSTGRFDAGLERAVGGAFRRRPMRVIARPSALGLVVAAAALAGCAAERGEDPEAVIRGWSRATNAGDYRRAGAFFAPNAVVEQVDELRLRGPADGARFSASLPCRADVTRVVSAGRTGVASFRLRDGETPCSGSAEVRFAVRGGKLTEWRQLPPPQPPEGLETFSPASPVT